MAVGNKPRVELCHRSTRQGVEPTRFPARPMDLWRLKQVPARMDPSGNRGKFGPPIRHFILWKLQRLYGVRLATS